MRGLHRFEGRDGDQRVSCVISQIALTELAPEVPEGRPGELFDRIEHRVFNLATRKYQVVGLNARGTLALNSADLTLLD
jgi:hypothetical protein